MLKSTGSASLLSSLFWTAVVLVTLSCRCGGMALSPAAPSSSTTDATSSVNDSVVIQSLLGPTLTIRIPFNGTWVSLTLTLQQNCSTGTDGTVPVWTSQDGTQNSWSGQAYATYVDASRQCSIVAYLDTAPNNITTRKYMGNFVCNNQRYELTPMNMMDLSSISADSVAGYSTTMEGQDYMCTMSTPPVLSFLEDSVLETIQQQPRILTKRSVLESQSLGGGRYRRSATTMQSYTVKLFIVADYSIFSKWFLLSTANSNEGKNYDAITNIQYYFAHVVNGINSRYATINQTDFSITVKLVGFFIATTPADSAQSPQYVTSEGFNVYKALDSLQVWTRNIRAGANMPQFDAAMLFTSDTLEVKSTTGGFFPISGLANIAQLCNSYSISICYDGGEYASIETGAHELGHNVGAYHDGQLNINDNTINSCKVDDQYIMAPYPELLTSTNFYNPFGFSSCSIQYFRTYLTSGNANCTITNTSVTSPPTVTPPTPSQPYTVDKQCQLLYGPSSFYCAGGPEDTTLCSLMSCWDASSSMCVQSATFRAYDYTTCGNGKWCLRGTCMADPLAPNTTKDTCIYGDYRGVFRDNTPFTCSDVLTSQPWRCYDTTQFNVAAECCDTCLQIRNNSNPGCEYGNGQTWCNAQVYVGSCYDSNIRNVCCASCAKQLTNDPTCQYGDHSASCSASTSYSCINNDKTCCESCKKFKNPAQPGCPYGDSANWCQNYISSNKAACQQAYYQTQCCGSCLALASTVAVTTTTMTTAIPSTTQAQTSTTTITPTTTTIQSTTPGLRLTTMLSLTTTTGVCNEADWCPTYIAKFPGYCYQPSELASCCKSCLLVKTGPKGCEYGDKVDWCVKYISSNNINCQKNDYINSPCCATCTLQSQNALG